MHFKLATYSDGNGGDWAACSVAEVRSDLAAHLTTFTHYSSSSSLRHTLLVQHVASNYVAPMKYELTVRSFVWTVVIQFDIDCFQIMFYYSYIHVRSDLPLSRLTFLIYPASASLADVFLTCLLWKMLND